MKIAAAFCAAMARHRAALIANLLGAFFYLLVSACSWGNPEEPGSNGADPLLWILYAGPVLLIFFLADNLWLWRPPLSSIRQRLLAASLIIGMWMLAGVIDFTHHTT